MAAAAVPLPEPPWPPGLAPLKAVEDLLRCGICFDYFHIAMIIPQCSHNYCSLCIRKFLSYKTQCPTCCVAVSESDLKNNRTLDELVKSFNSARQQLLQLVVDAPVMSSPLACSRRAPGKSHFGSPGACPANTGRKEELPAIESFLIKENVRTPTEAAGPAGASGEVCNTETHHDLCSSSPEGCGKDDEVGSGKSPECAKNHEEPSTSVGKLVEKVECPVCGVAVPEQFVNRHLDGCLAREEKKDSLRSPWVSSLQRPEEPEQRGLCARCPGTHENEMPRCGGSGSRRKPMSKVVYNLLSDRELRRRLRAQGLSAQGSRQQLVRRHQDFVLMYNAQCDALSPKPVAEIVKELEKNEKIRVQLEFSKPSESSLTFTKDQTEKEIDEIHADYRNKHRNEFQFLVDQVNKRWKKSGKRKAENAQQREEAAAEGLPTDPGEDTQEPRPDLTTGTEQEPQAEAPDGKSSESPSLGGGQRSASPASSQSSGSTSSSCSDILRDVQETEVYSESSDNSAPELRVHKRKIRGSRTCRSDEPLPRSKRRKS